MSDENTPKSQAAYDQAAAELTGLSRAARYDKLLDFPTEFSFKAIGKGDTFGDQVRKLLDVQGHPNAILVERPSKKGRFVSITFTLEVKSGVEVDDLYTALEALPDLTMTL